MGTPKRADSIALRVGENLKKKKPPILGFGRSGTFSFATMEAIGGRSGTVVTWAKGELVEKELEEFSTVEADVRRFPCGISLRARCF